MMLSYKDPKDRENGSTERFPDLELETMDGPRVTQGVGDTAGQEKEDAGRTMRRGRRVCVSGGRPALEGSVPLAPVRVRRKAVSKGSLAASAGAGVGGELVAR